MTAETTNSKRKVWNILTNKKPRKSFQYEVPFRISGIPCLLGVSYFESVSGSFSYNADSDLDYYGYTECDYDILDRKGYPAAWLERKMTEDERCLAEEAIAEYIRDDNDY